jgi:hypothetical protein
MSIHSNFARESIITNSNIPDCKNCIHFLPDNHRYGLHSDYHRCKKFGEKNIITGKVNYYFADYCRKYESLCGLEGKHFIKEPNLKWKLMNHYIRSYKIECVCVGLIVGLVCRIVS